MASHSFRLHVVAGAAALACHWASAQTLPAVTVTGKSAEAAPTLAGFGEPPAKLPLQAQSVSAERLLDAGISQLSGLTRLDASLSDSYDATGYWTQLKARGFEIDNRYNFRREGLPISGETSLSLSNKASVEVLKGISGMQAGVSSPAGLVNLVVKRPLADDATTLLLGVEQRGSVAAGFDHSQRLGAAREFGVRVNVEAAHLDPPLRNAKGHTHTVAVAADWRASADSQWDVEFEHHRHVQPSQPGFSLLGNRLPDARDIDPRLNLNNQPWSQPVAFSNLTGSVRFQQRLSSAWRWQGQFGVQRLKTDDRIAFPFGCTAADGVTYYGDRYCPDGSFDLYDYRSENERRNTRAADLALSGSVSVGGMKHDLSIGWQSSRFESRFQGVAFNPTGTGRIDGTAITPASPETNPGNVNRDERSQELYLRDRVSLGPTTTAWLGWRQTRLHRQAAGTDGSAPTDYTQRLNTPWLALSQALTPDWLLYASWGKGLESEVVPNVSRYLNQRQVLPALESRQTEVGIKTGNQRVDGSLTWFDVRRPLAADIGSCDKEASCERRIDGSARHRGLEASADLKWPGGGVIASVMSLRARREGSTDLASNGLRPANVPETTFKTQVRHNLWPELQAQLGLAHEGGRFATPDNAVAVPGWTTVNAGLRYLQTVAGQRWTWRLGVDNLLDHRAWRESPYQFSHSYLYPLAPRTWRANLEIAL